MTLAGAAGGGRAHLVQQHRVIKMVYIIREESAGGRDGALRSFARHVSEDHATAEQLRAEPGAERAA